MGVKGFRKQTKLEYEYLTKKAAKQFAEILWQQLLSRKEEARRKRRDNKAKSTRGMKSRK